MAIANGAVALVLQDDSYNINLAISYSNSRFKFAFDRRTLKSRGLTQYRPHQQQRL